MERLARETTIYDPVINALLHSELDWPLVVSSCQTMHRAVACVVSGQTGAMLCNWHPVAYNRAIKDLYGTYTHESHREHL